jgi:hypothetical protein
MQVSFVKIGLMQYIRVGLVLLFFCEVAATPAGIAGDTSDGVEGGNGSTTGSLERPLEAQDSGNDYDHYLKYLQVQMQMGVIGRLAEVGLPINCGVHTAPDNLADKSEEYKRQCFKQGSSFTVESFPIWDDGDVLRIYFEEGHRALFAFPLSDPEFDHFLQDPYDPEGGRFVYSYSPGTKADPDFAIVISSKGPDQDRDIDFSGFEKMKPNYGLSEDTILQVYDPTNGALSNGDIVVPYGRVDCAIFGNARWVYPVSYRCSE